MQSYRNENSRSPQPRAQALDRSGDQRPFECTRCGRRYRWKGSLSQHLKHECGKEPQLQCPYCTYRGRHRSHLKRHITFVHPGNPVSF